MRARTRCTPRRPEARRVRILLTTGLLVLLGACAEQAPIEPSAAGRYNFGSPQQATLRIRLNNWNGTPATDGTIVVQGPNGPVSQAVVNGEATFVLPTQASYCAYAIPASRAAARTRVVPPPDGAAPQYAGMSGQAAVVTGASLQSLGLTASNYRVHCLQSRPLQLTGDKQLTLGYLRAHQLVVNLLDLDGRSIPGLGVWTIGTGLTREDFNGVPWANFASLPPDILPGLLYSLHVTSSPAPGFTPPGASAVIEVLKDVPASAGRKQGFLTVTKFLGTGAGGQTSELELQLEPFSCEARTHGETYGDASGSVDFGPVKYGFRARPDLTPDLSGVMVSWEQQGFGQATFNQRFIIGPTRQLNATYTCGPDGCIVNGVSGNALSGGAEASLFFAPLGPGGSYSKVRVTLIVTGVPANLQAANFSIKSSGDNVPNPSRSNAAESQILIPFPGSPCAYTNDDRWALVHDLL